MAVCNEFSEQPGFLSGVTGFQRDLIHNWLIVTGLQHDLISCWLFVTRFQCDLISD